ncbi:glycosyltransferase family 2 protein [Flavobacterium rhizosphaerae]|uniref:Glycosyltransferase family A protein n=1 Tax=Flavobacterium rhizosphaerae TaxID=3163298 RepID=A0ABW8Z0J2_9FLAO
MLSILIPAYNYEVMPLVSSLCKQCIESNIIFEVIVINDSPGLPVNGENNGVTTLNNCRLIQNESNLGRTVTRKLLAESAKYNTLLFLDADVKLPDNLFIKRYLSYIGKNSVVMGGYSYEKQPPAPDKMLRYKYGKQREQKEAAIRSQQPYGTIFSGNFLTPKHIFLENNYQDSQNLYGLDNYFSYKLFKNNVDVVHINNPILHLGLENNEVFFKKCLQSVQNRKNLLVDEPDAEKINSLIRHYITLKKYRIDKLIGVGFKITEPLLKKMIFKKDPSLLALDIYRLGYICHIK